MHQTANIECMNKRVVRQIPARFNGDLFWGFPGISQMECISNDYNSLAEEIFSAGVPMACWNGAVKTLTDPCAGDKMHMSLELELANKQTNAHVPHFPFQRPQEISRNLSRPFLGFTCCRRCFSCICGTLSTSDSQPKNSGHWL